jgi:hypothetical protein
MHNSTYCTDQKVRVNININYFWFKIDKIK